MTPGELVCRMEGLGLTIDNLAILFDNNERLARRWLTGKALMPVGLLTDLQREQAIADRAVELIIEHSQQPGAVVVVYTNDPAQHTAHPEIDAYPSRWWRTIAARAWHQDANVTVVTNSSIPEDATAVMYPFLPDLPGDDE